MKLSVKTITLSAVLAALTCVATMVIQVPSPMRGYVNMGDMMVLTCAWLLGPFLGALAAGIGSALADLIGGYFIYVPGTFIIKALIAIVAGLVYATGKKRIKQSIPLRVVAGILGEIIMVGGYFLYAALLMGEGLAAATSIPGNIVQAVFGIVAGTAVCEILMKNRAAREYLFLWKTEEQK